MGCGVSEDVDRGLKEEVARGGSAEAARRMPATAPGISDFSEGII